MYPAKSLAECLRCTAPIGQRSGRGRERRFCKPSCGVLYRRTLRALFGA